MERYHIAKVGIHQGVDMFSVASIRHYASDTTLDILLKAVEHASRTHVHQPSATRVAHIAISVPLKKWGTEIGSRHANHFRSQ